MLERSIKDEFFGASTSLEGTWRSVMAFIVGRYGCLADGHWFFWTLTVWKLAGSGLPVGTKKNVRR